MKKPDIALILFIVCALLIGVFLSYPQRGSDQAIVLSTTGVRG